MPTPKSGGTKHTASPALQKVGGNIPLSTHRSTPMSETTTCSKQNSQQQTKRCWEYSQNFTVVLTV